jgi:hypothetical protein
MRFAPPRLLLILAMLLVLPFGLPGQETRAGSGSQAGSPQVRSVNIATLNGCQLDVWVDGRRVGQTPVRARLAPGFIVLTAGNEGFEPVILETEVHAQVPPGTMQTILIEDRVIEADRFPLVFRQLVTGMMNHPENAHIKMLATLLTQDREDFEGLKEMIPEEHHGDPIMMIADAGWLAREGDVDGAVRMLEDAGQINPGLASVWRAQARLMMRMDNLDDAAIIAGRAVVLEQANPQNDRTRALIAESAGQERAAELDREEARTLEAAMDERLEQARRQRMQIQ